MFEKIGSMLLPFRPKMPGCMISIGSHLGKVSRQEGLERHLSILYTHLTKSNLLNVPSAREESVESGKSL